MTMKIEIWRILTSKKIHAIVKSPTVVGTISLNKFRWFEHEQKMNENRIPQKNIHMNLGKARLRDKPRKR